MAARQGAGRGRVSGPPGRPSCAGWRRGCGGCCPSGRFEPVPGEPGSGTSSARCPARSPAIVIGAHYDTLVKPKGFVGANNGAAGTAVVVEVARALARARRRGRLARGPLRPLRRRGARGRAARGEPRLLPLRPARLARLREGAPRRDRGHGPARLRRQQGPQAARARAAPASRCGAGSAQPRATSARERFFPDYSSEDIVDDHSPFLRAGVPAVDLIDWRYHGHDLSDGLDKLSPGEPRRRGGDGHRARHAAPRAGLER